MPGLVAFRRRWSIGSDDLAVPGAFFFLLHAIWLIVLSVALSVSELQTAVQCQGQLFEYILGYLVILSGCLLLEACIVGVSMRGTILETAPREAAHHLLYVRLGVMAVEIAWLVVGVIWLVKYYNSCHAPTAKEAMIGAVICNWISVTSALIMVWCTYDPAGRSWVKMKNYQRTMKDGQKKFQYKRSGSHHRNWRQRKVLRAYRDSWDSRCRMLFCCMDRSARNQNSFADIAQLLSEFFRDLDVVPSDIIAGLVLLRKVQKLERNNIVKSSSNDTYEFLSGVKVTPTSTFLALNKPDQLAFFKDVIHYMRFAMSIYGWPVFMMQHSSTGFCRLCPYLKCGCKRPHISAEIVEDNCCMCNMAATQKMAPLDEVELVYVTYHVDIGETPFLVAVDHHRQTVIVCIRGTMSMKDVVTDLECEGEPIPTNPVRDDWLGHRGMVQTAEYIRDKMASESLLERAFAAAAARGSSSYRLVLIGHSLGAGTAAILAILLRDAYPDLRCFSYSPPGGLLSMPAVEYSKEFITSVVVGKDVVPRIGLHQLEQLRSDLMEVIKHSKESKWRSIAGGMSCCSCTGGSAARTEACSDLLQRRTEGRQLLSAHPSDSTIALTVHQPLYPPGRVMHVVRHHPGSHGRRVGRAEPVYQAIWVENDSFDEVLISPVMIQDHMPDKVLQALEKTLAACMDAALFSPRPAPAPDGGGRVNPACDALSGGGGDSPDGEKPDHPSRPKAGYGDGDGGGDGDEDSGEGGDGGGGGDGDGEGSRDGSEDGDDVLETRTVRVQSVSVVVAGGGDGCDVDVEIDERIVVAVDGVSDGVGGDDSAGGLSGVASSPVNDINPGSETSRLGQSRRDREGDELSLCSVESRAGSDGEERTSGGGRSRPASCDEQSSGSSGSSRQASPIRTAAEVHTSRLDLARADSPEPPSWESSTDPAARLSAELSAEVDGDLGGDLVTWRRAVHNVTPPRVESSWV